MSDAPLVAIGDLSTAPRDDAHALRPAEASSRDRLFPVSDMVVPPPSAPYRYVKPVLDQVVALTVLVVTTPIWIVVALAVACTSKGPVLFRQSRVGHDGREFTVFKFRTMCIDAHERLVELGLYDTYVATGFKLHVSEECRVTSVGSFLRRTSLDELPQLLNVLRGDMSLVGPRPVVPEELRCYGDLVHCYLGVRPGITGMWQVSGRSHVRFPERAYIDQRYFEQRTIRTDLSILLRTPIAVLRAEGAY